MDSHTVAATTPVRAEAGKYLTFNLASEVYGLEILKVQEIIGIMQVTRVPCMPDFVRGVINLRGKVIPVVDLRLKFRMSEQQDTEKTCIIVVQVARSTGQITMGIIVDEVSEVMDITGDQIEPAPSFGTNVDTEFILGMGKVGQRVVILLDIEKVLSSTEIELVDTVAEEAGA
ncbi:MAG: purine-binding chemotaxis protein CheW [Phycisphaerae bacterium]|nr:purine-binding chemotaxis protein CheW [Phycisphaerae bacterium]